MGSSIKFTDNSDKIAQAFLNAETRGLEKIGLVAEGYAKKACPVKTGALRNSISHAVEQKSAYLGSNLSYAAPVELGTSKQKAQPYLKPAAADHAQTYRKIMQEEMKNG